MSKTKVVHSDGNGFALVQFATNEYGIYSLQKISNVNGSTCIVKHGGAKYQAYIITEKKDKKELEDMKRQLEAKCHTEESASKTSERYQNQTEDFPIHEMEENNMNNISLMDYSIGTDLIEMPPANRSTSTRQNIVIDFDDEDSDDSIEDPNFSPESDISSSNEDVNEETEDKSADSSIDKSANSLNITGFDVCDDSNMFVKQSEGRNGSNKANFCMFCLTKQMKIARHFELKHKLEEPVKKFLELPKKSLERRKCIEVLRKKGNYIFNTDKKYNDGELIVTRRPNTKFLHSAQHYKACGNCKAYFAKTTLRMHFKKCSKKVSSRSRSVMVLSRKVMARINSKANSKVRNELFPPLREDHIVRAIRYDELIIIYANKMVQKYKHARHYELIRQRIRLMGRFLIQIRSINPEITDLTSVYDPGYIDDTTKAINVEARLDSTTDIYKVPTVASGLSTLLKQIGNILVTECIKRKDEERRKSAENFLLLLQQEVYTGINRTVAESQYQEQRRKKVELPTINDIKRLHSFLTTKRTTAFQKLKSQFNLQAWTELSESTLISIQLYNRRRAGESERILIEDFNSYTGINEDTDGIIFKKLSSEHKNLAKKYVRFLIRGKLNRNVPVLLDEHLLACVKLILKYRTEAKVHRNNPYVFGVHCNDSKRMKYLRACNLLRAFAFECGAENPERLRGTQLRKQMATQCVGLNLSENEIAEVANFMGHSKEIHKTYYRQSLASRDILKMSRILETAQGIQENEETSSEDENEDEEYQAVKSEALDTEESPLSLLKTKKKRSTSPYGKVKRSRWTEEEKSVVLAKYAHHIKEKTLPSLQELDLFIKSNPTLKRMRAAQVKTWIHNKFTKNM